jgi:single-strand DNA-binding protein
MAVSVNKVILAGNLTRDPEVRYTPKGTAVGEFGLAINDSYKAQDGSIKETVTYVDIEVWGRQAETCKQYLSKGRSVLVDGQLKFDQWESEGQKKSKLRVRADRVQFLSSPGGAGGQGGGSGGGGASRGSYSGGGGPPGEQAPKPSARPASTPAGGDDAPPLPDDDDIPF